MSAQNASSRFAKAAVITGVSLALGLAFNHFFYDKLPGLAFPVFVALIVAGLFAVSGFTRIANFNSAPRRAATNCAKDSSSLTPATPYNAQACRIVETRVPLKHRPPDRRRLVRGMQRGRARCGKLPSALYRISADP